MLMKEFKFFFVLFFLIFFFFQESTTGNKTCKELTYKQVVAFHPSPSKGFSHMPGNIKHTIAQHYLLTASEPHQIELFTERQGSQKAGHAPSLGVGNQSISGSQGVSLSSPRFI